MLEQVIVLQAWVALHALVQSGQSGMHCDTGQAYRDKDGSNRRALSSHCCYQLMTPQDFTSLRVHVIFKDLGRDRRMNHMCSPSDPRDLISG